MSPVLIDTSVWIDFFRRGDAPESDMLVELIRRKLARITGLVAAELLSGAGSGKEFATLQDYLSALDRLDDPPDLWPRVAAARYRLARKGFQASVADTIVAVVAHHHRASLLTRDAHFVLMARTLPLKLVRVASH